MRSGTQRAMRSEDESFTRIWAIYKNVRCSFYGSFYLCQVKWCRVEAAL